MHLRIYFVYIIPVTVSICTKIQRKSLETTVCINMYIVQVDAVYVKHCVVYIISTFCIGCEQILSILKTRNYITFRFINIYNMFFSLYLCIHLYIYIYLDRLKLLINNIKYTHRNKYKPLYIYIVIDIETHYSILCNQRRKYNIGNTQYTLDSINLDMKINLYIHIVRQKVGTLYASYRVNT